MTEPLQPIVPAKRRRLGRDAMVAASCGLLVALMVGASYAAVPFYNWFWLALLIDLSLYFLYRKPAIHPFSTHSVSA